MRKLFIPVGIITIWSHIAIIAQQMTNYPLLLSRINWFIIIIYYLLSRLSNLHDIFQEANLKYEIFVATLKFARSTRHVELVLPHFKAIEGRIREWGINSKQTRELYRLIRDSLKASNKRYSLAFDRIWTVSIIWNEYLRWSFYIRYRYRYIYIDRYAKQSLS